MKGTSTNGKIETMQGSPHVQIEEKIVEETLAPEQGEPTISIRTITIGTIKINLLSQVSKNWITETCQAHQELKRRQEPNTIQITAERMKTRVINRTKQPPPAVGEGGVLRVNH